MHKHRVLHVRYLPTKLPLTMTFMAYMAMDFYKISDVTRGVLYTLMVILWVVAIGMKIMEKSITVPEWDKEA